MGKKEQTRQKIVDAVGQTVRQHGYGGVGVDGIAKEAGVTSGAFYGHFSSKGLAFEAAVADGMKGLVDGVKQFQQDKGENWVNPFIDWYLGEDHKNDICTGCALPGLSVDVSRAIQNVHLAYEKEIREVVDIMAEGLPGANKQAKKKTAWSLLAILAGGVIMQRAVGTDKIAKEISIATRQTAKKITE
jgi:TetR/AcrR family transcriptional regulator, transcriptional repressor for nem operon